jgi:hypothetical protein
MKSFRTYMAETGQQSTLDDLERNQRFGEAEKQYNSSGMYGSGGRENASGQGYSGGAVDFKSILQDAIKAQQEANKPAVESLQASIPETQKAYQTKTTQLQANLAPLQERYNNLLNSIKGQQTQSVNKQTLATGNELGKRGIPMSSGLSQQEMINAVEPVNQFYTGQAANVGSEREAAIKALNDQINQIPDLQAADVRAINNAIAQLQAGGNQSAIQGALSQYQISSNAQQAAAQQALQQQQLQADQAAQQFQMNQSNQLFPLQLKNQQLQNQALQKSLNKTSTTSSNPYAQPTNSQWELFNTYSA